MRLPKSNKSSTYFVLWSSTLRFKKIRYGSGKPQQQTKDSNSKTLVLKG